MKKFQFSLQRVQGYKNQLLDREKNSLMQLNAQRREAEESHAAMCRLLEELNGRLHEEAARGVTAAELKSFDMQIESARYQIKRLTEHRISLDRSIERQIQVVVAATQEVSSFDKLEEKQREVYLAEVAKDDEAVIAEFVSTQVIRRQRSDSPAS